MKKNLFIAIFCIAFSSLSFGQFLKIISSTGNVITSDTITVWGNTTSEMQVTFNVVNTGIDSVNVYARRDSISTPPLFDSNNTFCWELCFSFGDKENVSSFQENLNKFGSPGDTCSSSFIGYYKPRGYAQAAYIRYTVFPGRNHADSSWVMVKYDATPAGIASLSDKNINFSIFPNPATNFVNFNYSFTNNVQTGSLKIFNMLGECVQTQPLSPLKNSSVINVQTMPSGIYICEIDANGSQPIYQKLVVSH